MPHSRHHSTEEYEEALRQTGGFRSAVARTLGVTPAAVTKKIKKSLKLQKLIAEIEETKLDIAESALMKALNKGEWRAVEFYLKTKGKHRGYVEQTSAPQDTAPRPMIFVDANTVVSIRAGGNGDGQGKAKVLTLNEVMALSDGNGSSHTGT